LTAFSTASSSSPESHQNSTAEKSVLAARTNRSRNRASWNKIETFALNLMHNLSFPDLLLL
jgi:hypothetical protein